MNNENYCVRNGGGSSEEYRVKRKRQIDEEIKAKGDTKRQKKRGKTLLTSTEGHREEEEVTTSPFRIQNPVLVLVFQNVPMASVQWFPASTPEH